MFPSPRKDFTSVVIAGVGHISMPSSFIGFVRSWLFGLSNPSCSVLVIQEVHSSGSVKRLLSLDRRNTHCVFSMPCSFVWISLSLLSVFSCSFFWFRNISSVLVWDVVRECGLEDMTNGSNNPWFVLVISHLSLSLICSSSYPQHASCSVKYLAPMS